jgi:hypothetical protein
MLPRDKISPSLARTSRTRGKSPLGLQVLTFETAGDRSGKQVLKTACAKAGLNVRISKVGRALYRVQIPDRSKRGLEASWALLVAVAEVVAELEEVHWIEPSFQASPMNMKAVGAVMGGVASIGSTHVWDMGVNGTGQVIGMHDTGLDQDHCMFKGDNGHVTTCNDCQQRPRLLPRGPNTAAYSFFKDNEAFIRNASNYHTPSELAGEGTAEELRNQAVEAFYHSVGM